MFATELKWPKELERTEQFVEKTLSGAEKQRLLDGLSKSGLQDLNEKHQTSARYWVMGLKHAQASEPQFSEVVELAHLETQCRLLGEVSFVTKVESDLVMLNPHAVFLKITRDWRAELEGLVWWGGPELGFSSPQLVALVPWIGTSPAITILFGVDIEVIAKLEDGEALPESQFTTTPEIANSLQKLKKLQVVQTLQSHDWEKLHAAACLKHKDFYCDHNLQVQTTLAHRRRGNCCGSGCRHCPWGFSKKTSNPRTY